MNTPKIDWYGRDEPAFIKGTAQPELVAEVMPTVTPVAKEVPEYPTDAAGLKGKQLKFLRKTTKKMRRTPIMGNKITNYLSSETGKKASKH